MRNDNVVPGIGVGGMTNKYEIKILICYLLNSIKLPLSREQLTIIFQDEQLVNYFSFCDALTEMLDSGHLCVIREDNKESYSLNPLGVETAERLDHSLPTSLRDKVVSTAMKILMKAKIEQENEVSICSYQNGYMVKCAMHDMDFDLMRLEIYAPDKLQAEKIKEKLLDNPTRIYQGIIQMLVDETL